uniref:Uncharacterized protein n=1 Tax=Branchiostoma floridae TaxID=7739 RepID=C3XRW9_BRAFL|eukprot:XP_002613428.1 hypothetical protein BRAFLDRAFT_84549 [Branchiostoma floridae]
MTNTSEEQHSSTSPTFSVECKGQHGGCSSYRKYIDRTGDDTSGKKLKYIHTGADTSVKPQVQIHTGNLQKLERSERRKLERIRKENELQEACLGEASHGDGQVEPVGRGGRSSGQGILRAGEVKHAVVTAEGRRKTSKISILLRSGTWSTARRGESGSKAVLFTAERQFLTEAASSNPIKAAMRPGKGRNRYPKSEEANILKYTEDHPELQGDKLFKQMEQHKKGNNDFFMGMDGDLRRLPTHVRPQVMVTVYKAFVAGSVRCRLHKARLRLHSREAWEAEFWDDLGKPKAEGGFGALEAARKGDLLVLIAFGDLRVPSLEIGTRRRSTPARTVDPDRLSRLPEALFAMLRGLGTPDVDAAVRQPTWLCYRYTLSATLRLNVDGYAIVPMVLRSQVGQESIPMCTGVLISLIQSVRNGNKYTATRDNNFATTKDIRVQEQSLPMAKRPAQDPLSTVWYNAPYFTMTCPIFAYGQKTSSDNDTVCTRHLGFPNKDIHGNCTYPTCSSSSPQSFSDRIREHNHMAELIGLVVTSRFIRIGWKTINSAAKKTLYHKYITHLCLCLCEPLLLG